MTVALQPGFRVQLAASAMAGKARCVDPAQLTAATCVPWHLTYGMHFGDGNASAVELTVIEVSADLSDVGGFVVMEGTVTHRYTRKLYTPYPTP